MPTIRIDRYRVIQRSGRNVQRAAVVLYGTDGGWIGTLFFHDQERTELPNNNQYTSGTVILYNRYDEFFPMMDMLRNESPLWLYISGSGTSTNAYIRTGNEEVGEGELRELLEDE